MLNLGVIGKNNEIKTDHLIVLCEILDDYKSFCYDLEGVIKSNDRDLVTKVYHAMLYYVAKKRLPIGSEKYKKIIEKHKHTIEVMYKYLCLSNLTIFSYDSRGNRIKNLPEDYFYQYINEHKEDVGAVKALALKIKSLGIDTISFDEKLDFTGTEYELNALFGCNFAFLENMEVNPTYLDNPIKYKSNGSYYCIMLKTDSFTAGYKEISKYNRSILLNSLTFDPNRLPKEITLYSTIGEICKLAGNKKIEYENIRNSVDLSITISNLKDNFEHLEEVFKRIDKTNSNQELVNLLDQMQNTLTQLQSFGVNFENQIIDSNEDITDKTMEREKRLYLDRKNYNN